jgi:hypothetical protein
MQPFEELLNGVHSATVTEIAVLVREVRVRVGVLSSPVTIRIYHQAKSSEPFTFEISAVMQTGSKGKPQDSPCGAPTEIEALRRAVVALTQDYEDAVRRGEIPDDRWLVEPAAVRE